MWQQQQPVSGVSSLSCCSPHRSVSWFILRIFSCHWIPITHKPGWKQQLFWPCGLSVQGFELTSNYAHFPPRLLCARAVWWTTQLGALLLPSHKITKKKERERWKDYVSCSGIKNEIVGKGKGHKEKRILMGYNAEKVNSSSFAQTVILRSLLPPFF